MNYPGFLHFVTTIWKSVINSFIKKQIRFIHSSIMTVNFIPVIVCFRFYLLMEELISGKHRSIVLNNWRKIQELCDPGSNFNTCIQ